MKINKEALLKKGVKVLTDKGKYKVDLFEKLMWLEEKLASSIMGWHKMSEWWRTVLKKWFKGGKKRFAVRVGRRGGKSSTLCRVAVVLVLFGAYKIPAGDCGEFIFMSVSKKEAKSRLTTIKQILDVLQVRYHATKEEIQLLDMPRKFCVYGASSKFTVGMTCIGIMGDEVARWENDDSSANPAPEIYGSVRPAMKTQPLAKELMCSSPWSELDYHYETIEQGDTDLQDVAVAATWVANPSPETTFKECRKEEPDDETFWREYGGVPMRSGLSTFFDPKSIDLAMANDLVFPAMPKHEDEVMVGADFAFISDWACCQVFHRGTNGIYRQADTLILKPEPEKPLKFSATCQAFADLTKKHHAGGVMADSYYREAILEHLIGEGLGFLDAPTDPHRGFLRMRVLLSQGQVQLKKDRRFARLLKEVQSQPTRNGRISMRLPKRKGSGHADDISAMVLALFQKEGWKFEDEAIDEGRGVHISHDETEDQYVKRLEAQLQAQKSGDDPIFEDVEYITYDY